MRLLPYVLLSSLILTACTNTAPPTATLAPTATATLAPTATSAPVFELNEWLFIVNYGNGNGSVQRVNLGNYESISSSNFDSLYDLHIAPDGQSFVYEYQRKIYQESTTSQDAPRILMSIEDKYARISILAVTEKYAIISASDIYAIPLDGGDPIKLNPQDTSVESGYCNLDREIDCFTAISPDQTQLAYFAYNSRASSVQVYLSNLTSGETVALGGGHPGNEGSSALQFSPDGQYVIALTDQDSFYNSHMIAFPVDGGDAIDLGNSVGNVLITADNHAIVAARPDFDAIGHQIFSVSLQDGSRQALIPDPLMELAFYLSPDSNYLLYLGDGSSLRSLPTVGGEAVRLIDGQKYSDQLHSFRISPDSRLVAYVFAEIETAGLYTIPINGGERTLLAESERGRIRYVMFSPDSQYLLAFVSESEGINLYSYNLSDGSSTQLNRVPGSIDGWENIRLYITPDSKRVIYALDEDKIGEFSLYITPITGGEASKLAGSGTQIYLYPPNNY